MAGKYSVESEGFYYIFNQIHHIFGVDLFVMQQYIYGMSCTTRNPLHLVHKHTNS